MIICGTGHRPKDLPGTYSPETWMAMVVAATRILSKYMPERVISGMALGWDQALAQAAIDLNIPFIAAVPFEGYENRWFQRSKEFYYRLLDLADEVVYICPPGYEAEKMDTRNEWMVDNSDIVLALLRPGKNYGGTWNCVQYAQKHWGEAWENHVFTAWDLFLEEFHKQRKAEVRAELLDHIADKEREEEYRTGGRPAGSSYPTQVVNKRNADYDVYIGRGRGGEIPTTPGSYGYFGNPIKKGAVCPECGEIHRTGGSTLPCYRKWLGEKMAQDPVFAAELKKLKGKVLACWCSPNPCHGDVIAAVVEGWEPLFTETIDCTHCGGSGVYKWGACINGVYQHSGTCFQCRGTGKQTPEDQIRNHYYDLYGRKVRE